MSLIFDIHEFNKLKMMNVANTFSSKIDFEQQEWHFILSPNKDLDVKISYLFQFDRLENDTAEVYYNGVDESTLRYDILALAQYHIQDLKYQLN
ncbi:hypothetical protein [Moraxella marmotae]|uniref:hypothetical protein n=1 Tax=Moraxella marmotae TaxID=3344520 RepID=UPI0035F2E807